MSTKPIKLAGGCLCGAIRYEASEPPIDAGICHCRTCQKSTGSAFMVIAGFTRTAFQFTKSEPKLYRSSAIMEKGFCPHCGSLLFDRFLVGSSRRNPDIAWIQIGTLDKPEAVTPKWHSGVESQLPWVNFNDGLPRNRCDDDPDLAAALATAEAVEQKSNVSQC